MNTDSVCAHPPRYRFDLAGVVSCAMCGERLFLRLVPADHPSLEQYAIQKRDLKTARKMVRK